MRAISGVNAHFPLYTLPHAAYKIGHHEGNETSRFVGHVKAQGTIMPDHLHWLCKLTGDRSLSTCVNIIKSGSARQINRLRNCRERIWHKGFYDRAIRRDEDLVGVARYIVANPLRKGMVCSLRDYPLWDAVWL